jgi:ribosome recycling factor
VWTQQICDNKSLKNELDSFLNIVKNNLERLPEMIRFERDHLDTICENYYQDSIAYDLEFLWICESHVKKFDKENYLTEKEVMKYNAKIQDLKYAIRCIMIDQSLQS